jgi:integration host factor subunit alpha
MSGNTVARADLVETLSEETGLSRNSCSDLLDGMLAEIGACLDAGEPVKITNFGTLAVRRRPPRVGRNFLTGEPVAVASRLAVFFRASRRLRHYANHPEDLPKPSRRQLELF